MSKVIILVGPSGAGKTTIAKHLLNNPKYNLSFSISATTRPKRPNEIDGVDYYFLSKDDFVQKINQNQFIEWEEVYKDIFYGTLKSEIERLQKMGKNILFDVDVKGALNLKKYFKDNALAIFIAPPSFEELKNRLIKRHTENTQSLEKRLKRASDELKFKDKFDVVVVNDKLNDTFKKIDDIVSKFLLS